jgi:hypothetical protein
VSLFLGGRTSFRKFFLREGARTLEIFPKKWRQPKDGRVNKKTMIFQMVEEVGCAGKERASNHSSWVVE